MIRLQLAPPILVSARLQQCARCPLYVSLTGSCSPFRKHPATGQRGCGCFVQAKARLLHESCPGGQW